MTTLAFDGKTLAADTAMTYGGLKVRFTGKIRRFPSGCLAGFAGDVNSGLLLLDWLESDDPNALLDLPDSEEDSDACADAILITPDGAISVCGNRGILIPVEGPCLAVGSGMNLAMGLMLAGKSAREAVQTCIERDPYSGFDVISFDL